jgi:hypothetical protein
MEDIMSKSKKNKSIFYFTVLVIIISLSLYSSEEKEKNSTGSKEVQLNDVSSEGTVKLSDGNIDRARLIALRSAYAKAVQEEYGGNIGDLKEYRNIKLVSDIVAARSKGFIKEYKILKEGVSESSPDKYGVKIKASVVKGGEILKDETEGLKKFLEILGKPKILVILPEKELLGKTVVSSDSKESSVHLRSTEAAFARELARYGYDVITVDELTLNKKLFSKEDLEQAKAGFTAKALKVAKAIGTDLALIGVAKFSQEERPVRDVNFITVTTEASAKALIVSSGKLIELFHTTERRSHTSRLKAFVECVNLLAEKISKDLAWRIQQILAHEPRELQLKIKGISLAQAVKVSKSLSDFFAIDKVKSRKLPTQKSNVADFTLFTGYIPVEAHEIAEVFEKTLKRKPELEKSDKYEVIFSVKIRPKKLGDNI